MQLIQFLAACLFPGAQCFAVEMATANSSELDRASSSPSSSTNAAGSGSSLSSPSSSSSDYGRHSGVFKSRSRQESPSTTPLCFGASGGVGVGRRLLLRCSRARAPAKQPQKQDAAPKVKGDVIGRDRGRPGATWLHDRQEEIIATAAVHCDDCSDPGPSPPRPRRAAGWPGLGMPTMAKRFKESPCPCSASPSRDSSLAAASCAVVHDEESPELHHGHDCRGESSMSSRSLDEMEFLKTFDGDEEMINHHFITGDLKKRISSHVTWKQSPLDMERKHD
ncbi:hypothetical protein BDA96_10G309000 [Sorghum bicolor]|uniref:Ovate family protein n=1 Tax=Sorghum bicolor TaxID=4558 RepID=A0A921Q582_SORBI|nr:hypothetical protein BDA96_10G309000 [Sorghum bicolor]